MKKIKVAVIVIVGVFIFTSFTNYSIANKNSSAKMDIQSRIDSLLKIYNSDDRAGYSVAVSQYGKLIYYKNSGYANLEHKVPVDSKTLFAIASATKAFTGVALLKLYSEGKINLDSPVQKYVPQFPVKKKGEITVNMLVAHLSGIRHYGWTERDANFFSKHYDNVLDAINIFKDDSLIAVPGTKYNYSSYGYDLLASVIQSASGVKFQDYVKKEIFEPLHLTNTRYDDSRIIIPNRAQSYSYYDPYNYAQHDELYRIPYLDFSYNAGAGNILSTSNDLIKYGEALLKPGFLPEKEFKMLYTNQVINGVESPWSYGWFVEKDENGNKYLKINGSFPAFQSDLWVFPSDGIVVTILQNWWGKRPKIKKDAKPLVVQIVDIVKAFAKTEK